MLRNFNAGLWGELSRPFFLISSPYFVYCSSVSLRYLCNSLHFRHFLKVMYK